MEKRIRIFFKNNSYIFLIWCIYAIVAFAISIVNYPYIDDIFRRISGQTDFAFSYSRYISEFFAWVLNLNFQMVDLGLMTPIITSTILALASTFIIRSFFPEERIKWQTALVSTIIGISPFYLEALSFRFDAPFMAFSVLISILPFYFRRHLNWYSFIGLSAISVLAMCNTYQASSGIYIVMSIFTILHLIFQDEKWKKVISLIGQTILGYLTGLLIFAGQMQMNPQLQNRDGNTVIAGIIDLYPTIVKNINLLNQTLNDELNYLWTALIWFIILLWIVVLVVNNLDKIFFKLPLLLFSLVLSLPLSFGVYLAVTADLATSRPRYIYGVFIVLTIISVWLFQEKKGKLLEYISSISGLVLVYSFLSFGLVYANSLENQKDSFEYQSGQFASIIRPFLNEGGTKQIYLNKLFNNSKVYENSAKNYPILNNLVPDNGNLYWPNVMWFNSFSNLNTQIEHMDTMQMEMDRNNLVYEDFQYEIYQVDKDLYIRVK